MNIKAILPGVIVTLLVSACSSFSHTNIRQPDTGPEESRATFDIDAKRGDPGMLVILSLSGGGSRAAYLSASVMLGLEKVFAEEKINLLHEVDAISSVSGGSLPAAYYVISADAGEQPAPYGRVWDEATVQKQMKKNYIRKWFGNWFWPTNIGKFWFTAYDRSDIMAQTFADNMYDNLNSLPPGSDLKMSNMLDSRPYLVLNATNGTATPAPVDEADEIDSARIFGGRFTFTSRDFGSINSSINDYSLGRAVMASASFPAVFNYMTMQDFALSGAPGCTENCDRFMHVFDGGNADNLGLESVSDMLDALPCEADNYDRLVVILVDAFTGNSGISNEKPDPRKGLDFVVDTNFLEATDSLLSANRKEKVEHFEDAFKKRCHDSSKSLFYHIQFADIKDDKLRRKLNRIKTDFRISDDDTDTIDKAIGLLLTPQNTCVAGIRDLLVNGQHHTKQICEY
ncbi:MAG: patatin-like phospholipase family protein [Planctomycetia bacterium]|nr:patatin-like phospholipase family protein [Planctomycetia bacterium]